MKKLHHSDVADGSGKWSSYSGKQSGNFLKSWQCSYHRWPSNYTPKGIKIYVHIKAYPWMLLLIKNCPSTGESPSIGEWLNTPWYIHTELYYGILFYGIRCNSKKDWNIDTHLGGSPENNAEWKVTKRLLTIWFHLHKSWRNKIIKVKNRLVVTRDQTGDGWEESGDGHEGASWGWKCSVSWLYQYQYPGCDIVPQFACYHCRKLGKGYMGFLCIIYYNFPWIYN